MSTPPIRVDDGRRQVSHKFMSTRPERSAWEAQFQIHCCRKIADATRGRADNRPSGLYFARAPFAFLLRAPNAAPTAPGSHPIFRMLVRAQFSGKLKLCPRDRAARQFFRQARLKPLCMASTFGDANPPGGFLVFGLHIKATRTPIVSRTSSPGRARAGAVILRLSSAAELSHAR